VTSIQKAEDVSIETVIDLRAEEGAALLEKCQATIRIGLAAEAGYRP